MGTKPSLFERYPGHGHKPLGRKCGGLCRKNYGLALHQLTGQTTCCYCPISLVDTYDHWLLMSCEHVISETKGHNALGIPKEVLNDYSNLALCCSACNAFSQRYKFTAEVIEQWKSREAQFSEWSDALWQEFFSLRNRVFTEKAILVQSCQEDELRFYKDEWIRPLGS